MAAPAAAISIDPSEVEWTAVRAQGAGGQNVNKVSSAVQVRFDIRASSLPDDVKQLAPAVLAHRILTRGYRQSSRDDTAAAVLREILEQTPVPS